jgi:hypothetical protein
MRSRKRKSVTYNLLALLNTSLDFGNVSRGVVIGKLLNLMLANNG